MHLSVAAAQCEQKYGIDMEGIHIRAGGSLGSWHCSKADELNFDGVVICRSSPDDV